jgi:hypothetical protein
MNPMKVQPVVALEWTPEAFHVRRLVIHVECVPPVQALQELREGRFRTSQDLKH